MPNTTKPQLIFHIGDPKTGTTSLQHALHQGLVKCDSQKILPWYKRNAVALAHGLRLKQDDSLRWEPFENVPSWLNGTEADIAVISSEFFAWTKPTILHKALLEHVPDHADTTKVIAYVRPHASRFLAAYVQRIKAGKLLGDLDAFFEDTQRADLFKYSKRFGAWKRVFGSRFTLRPFVRSELRGGDIVTDFFSEILQGTPFEINEVIKENMAVTVRSLAGLNYVHCCLRKTKINPRGQRLIGEVLANTYLPAKSLSGEKPKLDRKMAERLIRVYSADAKALDTAFFDRPIMQEALENSLSQTSDQPFDLTPKTHFKPNEIKALSKLTGKLEKCFTNHRQLWATYYNLGKGNLKPTAEQSNKIERHRKKLEATEAMLEEVAAIIAD